MSFVPYDDPYTIEVQTKPFILAACRKCHVHTHFNKQNHWTLRGYVANAESLRNTDRHTYELRSQYI